jgi:hypothetical protein
MNRRPAATATQAAATKAEAAADALLAWLQTQPPRTTLNKKANEPAAERGEASGERPAIDLRTDVGEPKPSQRGLTGIAASNPSRDPARRKQCSAVRLEHTDWLHHRVLITGPTADLVRLRSAARGSGTVPWHVDFERMEEDLFHLLVSPPARAGALGSRACGLSLAGARILAGQLRAAAERRHAIAIARVGHSEACPFDLHALVPVPDAILRRGPDDQEALDWLWAHWGTTQTLRHVSEDEAAGDVVVTRRRAGRGQGVWVLTFWSADWTPWQALAKVAGGWPTLRFETRPLYNMP